MRRPRQSQTPRPRRRCFNRSGWILPGVGEKRAQAILDYREAHGPFRRVEDAAAVPGLTENIVASWAELAYVS